MKPFAPLLAGILTVTPPGPSPQPSPPADVQEAVEYSCAASADEGMGAGSVAFIQRDAAPVKLRLSLWQRFQLRRAKRAYIMVQPE